MSIGTWTPTAKSNMKVNSTGGAYYIKIGRLVYIYANINVNSLAKGGQNVLGGLPYTPVNRQIIPIGYCNIPSSWDNIVMQVNENGSIYPAYWYSGRSYEGDQCWSSTTAGSICFSGCYLTNS